MTDQQQGITPEELAKRSAAIRDAVRMSAYIPDELRARLEAGLSNEMRTAVLELQIIAIKFGRALERQDALVGYCKQDVEESHQRRPSKLALGLVNRAGQPIHKVDSEKKIDILVAPGFLDLTKKH